MSTDISGRRPALPAMPVLSMSACALLLACGGALAALPDAAASASPATAASASPARPTARPNPGDPATVVPPVAYRSSLEHYRRHADAAPRPWREANDEVLRIGGWRSYLRESATPGPAAASGAAR